MFTRENKDQPMYTHIKQLYRNQQTPGQIFGIRTNGVSILKLSQHEQFGFKHKRQVEEPHWSKKCRVATLKGTSTEMHHKYCYKSLRQYQKCKDVSFIFK